LPPFASSSSSLLPCLASLPHFSRLASSRLAFATAHFFSLLKARGSSRGALALPSVSSVSSRGPKRLLARSFGLLARSFGPREETEETEGKARDRGDRRQGKRSEESRLKRPIFCEDGKRPIFCIRDLYFQQICKLARSRGYCSFPLASLALPSLALPCKLCKAREARTERDLYSA